jgi:hypothetical protein
MIWPIRYFFITAGTGRLRYGFCFRSFKLTEWTAKLGVRNLHHIKSQKRTRGDNFTEVDGGFSKKEKVLTEQVHPTETQNLLGKEARRIMDNIFRVRPVGRRSRGGQA